MFKYFPQTDCDIKEMLERIGKKDIAELFDQIDPSLRKDKEFNLPSSHSEKELVEEMNRLESKNEELLSFQGAGAYDTFQFSVIPALTSRQEFLTAYTPYQPEISQGTLQYIFEFQSMICELTGMDVANASMYDGATATAEAMVMACSKERKKKVLVSSTVNPKVIEVVKTYAKFRSIEVELIEATDYATSLSDLKEKLSGDIATLIVQQPNFYGVIEDYSEINDLLKQNKKLFIMNVDPSTLPVLKTPASWGADIVCGEAQSLGIPLSFGGPYLGFLACTNKLMRKIPGRVSGMTKDVEGRRGFVLTLQAREQHIRREKATSNICSNQSLMALHVVIYLSLLGKKGQIEVAKRSYNNAHYLEKVLLETKRFKKVTDQPYFKEFVLEYVGNANELNDYLLTKGILGGYLLPNNQIMFCASETRTKEEMDHLARLVGEKDV